MMDPHFTPQLQRAKFLIQFLDQQPNEPGKNSRERRKDERSAARLFHFKFRTRNIVVNVAALIKFHQHERDDKTHCGPLEATQSKIKHPKLILRHGLDGVQLLATLHAEFPAIAVLIVEP